MKRIITVLLFLFLVISCDEPETVVTNYINPDGTVTRKIEMRNVKNLFQSRQVPYDSTWVLSDSVEINEKGDTTWVRRAEKTFANVSEINVLYGQDSGVNRDALRHVSLEKKFRWFNTEYRFSEIIDKRLANGYPIKDFLNDEELLYFYSPRSLKEEKENGPDSLRYRMIKDSVSYKTDIWTFKNYIAESILRFTALLDGKDQEYIVKALEDHKDELMNLYVTYQDGIDSLWNSGMLLEKLIGREYAVKYRSEADSATSSAVNLWLQFKDYSVRIAMPGKLTATNGFKDKSNVLLWPVTSDYFLAQPYEMWAESKVRNIWAWIVSGIFLLFVVTGVSIRIIKKAE